MAMIKELIKGNEGLVRAANIRTAAGRTNRAITRLVPLEVHVHRVLIQRRMECTGGQPLLQPWL